MKAGEEPGDVAVVAAEDGEWPSGLAREKVPSAAWNVFSLHMTHMTRWCARASFWCRHSRVDETSCNDLSSESR